jgi:hypothetical protein
VLKFNGGNVKIGAMLASLQKLRTGKKRFLLIFFIAFPVGTAFGAVLGWWRSTQVSPQQRWEEIADKNSELRTTTDGWQLVYVCDGHDYVTYDGVLGLPIPGKSNDYGGSSLGDVKERLSDVLDVIKAAIGFEITKYTLEEVLQKRMALVETTPSKASEVMLLAGAISGYFVGYRLTSGDHVPCAANFVLREINSLDGDSWAKIARKKRLFAYTEWYQVEYRMKYRPFFGYLKEVRDNLGEIAAELQAGDVARAQKQTGVPDIELFSGEIADANQKMKVYSDRISEISNPGYKLTLRDWDDHIWEIPGRTIGSSRLLTEIAFPELPEAKVTDWMEKMLMEDTSDLWFVWFNVIGLNMTILSLVLWLRKFLSQVEFKSVASRTGRKP